MLDGSDVCFLTSCHAFMFMLITDHHEHGGVLWHDITFVLVSDFGLGSMGHAYVVDES